MATSNIVVAIANDTMSLPNIPTSDARPSRVASLSGLIPTSRSTSPFRMNSRNFFDIVLLHRTTNVRDLVDSSFATHAVNVLGRYSPR